MPSTLPSITRPLQNAVQSGRHIHLPKNHKIEIFCHEMVKSCRKCENEAKAAEQRRKREWQLDQERAAKQSAYAAQLAMLDGEIQFEKHAMKIQAEDKDRDSVLAQKRLDLTNLKKARAAGLKASHQIRITTDKCAPASTPAADGQATTFDGHMSSTTPSSPVSQSQSPNSNETKNNTFAAPAKSANTSDWNKSEAKVEWEWQKKYELAENEELDSLMDMIGKSLQKYS